MYTPDSKHIIGLNNIPFFVEITQIIIRNVFNIATSFTQPGLQSTSFIFGAGVLLGLNVPQNVLIHFLHICGYLVLSWTVKREVWLKWKNRIIFSGRNLTPDILSTFIMFTFFAKLNQFTFFPFLQTKLNWIGCLSWKTTWKVCHEARSHAFKGNTCWCVSLHILVPQLFFTISPFLRSWCKYKVSYPFEQLYIAAWCCLAV